MLRGSNWRKNILKNTVDITAKSSYYNKCQLALMSASTEKIK